MKSDAQAVTGRFYTPARLGLLFLAIAVLLLLRKPDLLGNPQLYAEDASVFFRDQVVSPWSAVFQPYNGQFHLIPRFIALLEALFPISVAPLVCAFLSVIVHAICLSVVFLPWNRWLIGNDLLRAAAAVVLATGLDGEAMIGFSGPLMWYLFLAGMLLLFRPDDPGPEPRWRSVARVGAMAAIGLSAAPMTVLAPFALWRAIRCRGLQRALAMTLLAAIVVQSFALVFSERSDRPPEPLAGVAMLLWQVAAATMISWAYAGFVTPLAGRNAGVALSALPSTGPPLFVVIGVAVLVTWLLTSSSRQQRARLAIALYAAISPLALALYGRNLVGLALTLNSNAAQTPARYVVLAGAVLVYMACLIIERLRLPPRFQAACLILVFTIGIIGNFSQPPYPDRHWKDAYPRISAWRSARAAGRVQRLVIPIEPLPWNMVFPN